MNAHPDAGDPRASRRAAVLLWAMAAALFVPIAPDSLLHSTAYLVWIYPNSARSIVPVFLFAAVFATLTTLALRRGRPERGIRLAGLGALGAYGVGTLAVSLEVCWNFRSSIPPQYWVISIASPLVAAAIVRAAKGQRPWQMWERLLAGFCAVGVSTYPNWYLASQFPTWPRYLMFAASLFVGAQLALWLVLAVALLRGRSAPS